MSDNMHWASSLYESLAALDMNPYEWTLNYYDEETGGDAAIAIVSSKVALAFVGNNTKPLVKDGWAVIVLPTAEMTAFAQVWGKLKEFSVEAKTRKSAAEMIKSGSKEENALLHAILRAGIEEPDRNYTIYREDDNGKRKELTVPDFTWAKIKLAFFVDGLWWHLNKDSAEYRKAIMEAKDEEAIKAAEREMSDRKVRDDANRSELTIQGWTVLVCTDKDLSTPEGVNKQVQNIKRAMRRLLSIPQNNAPTGPQEPPVTPVQEPAVESQEAPARRVIRPAPRTEVTPVVPVADMDESKPTEGEQPLVSDFETETGSELEREIENAQPSLTDSEAFDLLFG